MTPDDDKATPEQGPGGYMPPAVGESFFTCPHCGILTGQNWAHGAWHLPGQAGLVAQYAACQNGACGESNLWIGSAESDGLGMVAVSRVDGYMIYPLGGRGPLPSSDLASAPARTFKEARSVLAISPRAAVALMRLCVEQLLRDQLKIEGKTLDKRIGHLAKQGIDPVIIGALDVVRVTGNDGVHDLQTMDVEEPGTAEGLMDVVNYIVQRLVTDRANVEALRAVLPEAIKEGIEARDS